MLGTGPLLAEVSFFLSLLPRRERPLLAGKVLGIFWKAQKLILIEKNQCVLIQKLVSAKQKNHLSPKINSRKNFVPHATPT